MPRPPRERNSSRPPFIWRVALKQKKIMSKREGDDQLFRSSVYLPPEIIFEVLSHLPPKSLARFKSVSPSWNSEISSPSFARTHFNRTKTNNLKHLDRTLILMCAHGFYSLNLNDAPVIATKMDLPSLQSPSGGLRMLGSCDGLLLVSHMCWSNFFLLNPSTRECKKLPTRPFALDVGRGYNSCLYGVGYDSYTHDYKVVMVFYHEDEDEYEDESPKHMMIVAVYSLKSKAWKKIQDMRRIVDGIAFGAWVNGRLHWMCRRLGSYFILALDLADEIFTELELPPAALFADEEITHSLYELVVLGGRLCVVYKLIGNHIEVWTLEENEGNMSWSKIVTGSHGISDTDISGLLAENEFLLMKKAKILPEITGDILVANNPQIGTLRNIVVLDIPLPETSWATHVESLISPNQE